MAAYLIAAIVFMAALAGAGFKGYQLGGNAKQVEWDAANVAAVLKAEDDRKAQDEKARKSASILQAKLATQAITTRELTSALDKELQNKPLPTACVITDELRNLINRAGTGQSETTRELPSTVKPASDIGK